MRFDRVAIESVAHVLPPEVVTSAQLEAGFAHTLRRIGLPPGQLEKLSGVRERRWWEPGTQPSVVCAMAGERALAKAGMQPSDVQALINTSVSRDYLEPATAALTAGHLGVGHGCQSFDVTNACLGFLNGMILGASMIELGQVDNVLITCGECVRDGVTATVDRLAAPDANVDTFRDNFASLTLGCGAVAMVLTRADISRTTHRLRGGVYRTASEHNALCLGQHQEMRSDPHGLLVHGVGLAVETWPYASAELGWGDGAPVDEFVCHQVSLAHFTSTFERLGFPLNKAMLTFPYLGNCGPASLPITLSISLARGRIAAGHELCLFAVGSGLGCAILGVRW
jgi:3-oxoacyl-[acyl-carrier-protein] synthase III